MMMAAIEFLKMFQRDIAPLFVSTRVDNYGISNAYRRAYILRQLEKHILEQKEEGTIQINMPAD